MAKIDDLLPKLRDEAEKEADMFSGKSSREFFIETVGAKTLDELLEMFDPVEHNEAWDKERQEDVPDIDIIMKNRRAIAFMAAGRLGAYRHYRENELRSHVQGIARMYWDMNSLKQTEYFTQMDSVKKA